MTQPVTFYSQGSKLVGRLWLPPEANDSKSSPPVAVIVTGSWMTVKEQMPAAYARLLAAAGLVALTFDFGGFGESGGDPREVESPLRKAEDIRNAAAFLRTHPVAKAARIGALAVCASAGYAAAAALGDSHLESLAMVAPWLHDAEIVRTIYGGEAAVKERLARAARARETYATTGEVEYVAAASNSDPSAAMYWPGDALDYYLNPHRGAIPEWGARFGLMAWKEWLEFDPVAFASRLNVPIRVITSENSATPAGARKFEAALRCRHDSVWMAGTQFDFYDDARTVASAAEHAIGHFQSSLG